MRDDLSEELPEELMGEQPVVGKTYKGSMVVDISQEKSTRPNGLIRIRKMIQLDDGIILTEDEFLDLRKIEGEYRELKYEEVSSPKGIKLPVNARDKKKKKPQARPLVDEDDGEKTRREAEESARREADKAAKKEEEKRALKEAQELAIRKEQEMQAKKEAEELRLRREERLRREDEVTRRKQEEDRVRKDAEIEARREVELQRQRQVEEERLRASQEAARKRKQEADRRKEAETRAKEDARRRAAIMGNWQPETMWVHSPESKIRRKDGSSESEGPKAIWRFAPGQDEDEDFSWWKPQSIVVHPPGKETPQEERNDDIPHGYWAYAPGTAPEDTDEEWNPQGGRLAPEIWVFPPGTQIPEDDEELQLQGEWTYPHGETTFPPLPTPENEWGPKTVLVHPKTKPLTANDTKDSNIHGVWKIHDGQENLPMGEEDWRVAEIQVYPNGQKPNGIDESEVQGIWGLAPGAKPDDDGEWNPSDLWFFGPGDSSPDDEDWNPQGVWTHCPDSERHDWPPLSEPMDEWGVTAIWVYPPNKLPDEGEEWQPSGVWNYGNALEEAEDWNPYQVTVHPQGKEPANLEDCKVHGVWGLAPGAVPDDDGNWKASDIWFVAPGEEPPEDWKLQGVWTVSPEIEEDAEDWPPQRATAGPEEPQMACVFPSSDKIPEESGQYSPYGVWMFSQGSGDEPDWMPQNVLLHKNETGTAFDESIPHGQFGYGPDAELDKDGNCTNPSDMWFYLPGETPPSDTGFIPQGTWIFAPGKVNIELPQPATFAKEPRQVGRLSEWVETESKPKEPTNVPLLAWVYPRRKAPKEIEKGIGKGVWSYTQGKKVMDAGKKATQVQLHDTGSETKEFPRRHGHWGYSPNAKPNDDGDYLPEDMWLFAPGETPPDEWQPKGVWTELPPKSQPRPNTNKTQDKGKAGTLNSTRPLERQFKKSAWVYPSKQKAPAKGETKNPQGFWTDCPSGSAKDGPIELLIYGGGEKLPTNIEKLPHGIFGYAPGSHPDEEGLWSPKDVLFYPPGQEAPSDLQQPGTWTYPHGSKTVISTSYKYVGEEIIYLKKTEIFYMDTVTSFSSEFTKK